MAINKTEGLNLWWVYVKLTDDKDEYVQVAQFLDWRPKGPDEFVKGQNYVVRTNKWNPVGKYDRCKVYILRMAGETHAYGLATQVMFAAPSPVFYLCLAETMDELRKCIEAKRPAIPRLNPRDSDYMSDVDGINLDDGKKRPRTSHNANVGAKKARAENKDMEKFVAQLTKSPRRASPVMFSQKPTAGSSNSSSKQSFSKTVGNSIEVLTSPTFPLKPSAPKHSTPKLSLIKPSAPNNTSSKHATHSATKPATPKASPSTLVAPSTLSLKSHKSNNPSSQVPRPSSSMKKNLSTNKSSNPSTHINTPLISMSTSVHSTEHPVRSKVEKQISKQFQTAFDSNAEDDIKKQDDEIEKLRQQLSAARDQLAMKDDVILGEIRSLAQRVGNIEKAITSKCPDSLHPVQL